MLGLVETTQTPIVAPTVEAPVTTVMYEGKVSSFAPKSLAILEAGWKRWRDLCSRAGVAPLPADKGLLIAAVKREIEAGQKRATIETTLLYPIRTASKRLEYPDPTASVAFKDFWKHACREVLTKRQKQAVGMTIETVEMIWADLRPEVPREALMGALVGLAYDGLLRVSELASLRSPNLRSVRGGAGELLIERSKTDQEGEGRTRSISPETMLWVERHRRFAQARMPEGDWIFPSPYRGGRAALSTRQAVNLIDEAGTRVGITGLSGHSGRVGGAQDMMLAGATLPQMQKRGGWKTSRMPARYAEQADTVLDGEERREQLARLKERMGATRRG
jgi:integrase